MNREQAALGAEERNGKSLPGSLRVRDGGRARPFVSVHLYLHLQLRPSLIHINM